MYEDGLHDWKYEVTFAENGKIITTHPNEITPDNDVWTQHNRNIEFSFNNEYSIYKGKRIDLYRTEGKAINSIGIK